MSGGVVVQNGFPVLWQRFIRPALVRPVIPLIVAITVLLLVQGGNARVGATGVVPTGVAGSGGGSSLLRQVDVQTPAPPLPLAGHSVAGVPYRVSGYQPQAAAVTPFGQQLTTEDVSSGTVDSRGVYVYLRDGKRSYPPAPMIQFSLVELDQYIRTNQRDHLHRAVASARALINHSVTYNGGMYFPYRFPVVMDASAGETITPPWWSAMAQASSLMLFTRLYHATNDDYWLDAAHRAFATLDDRGPLKDHKPWTAYTDDNGYLWLEQYAGTSLDPMLVLSGQISATFGLWDYYTQTRDPKAVPLFDAAVTTIREYLPTFRVPGGAAYFCLRAPLCQQPRWQSKKYHKIVTLQLRLLSVMTGDRWFADEANLFAADSH